MSKFSRLLRKRSVAIAHFGPNTINRAGGLAFQDTPRMALYRQVATSLWSGDGYYEKHAEWLARFQDNVAAALAEDMRYPFALAAFARDRRALALRSSPLGLYVEAAAHPASKGTGLVRRYAPRVLLRADEPAEAIAYFRAHHKGVIPHGLLRGIADTLHSFDEYQLAKYKDSGAVSMRDVLRLARPKPASDEERALWGRAVSRSLQTPYTWEVELSRCTNDEEKRAKWNELVASQRLGLFALVRNIRNMLAVGADIEGALAQITSEKVTGSGILPFQWYKAYKAIRAEAGQDLAGVMEEALQWSLAGVPKLPGTTLVVCDNSGSMSGATATRGMSNAEIGNLLGAMALFCCDQAVAGTFGDNFALANTDLQQHIMRNKEIIDECGRHTGHSTNAWRVFETLIREQVYVDRVILLSDMQCYDSGSRFAAGFAGHSLSAELESYRRLNPNVVVYSVNLATQDNSTQFAPDQPVVQLAGFSESIFQFIGAMEVGESIVPWITEHY